jgi:hypothetical protein
MGMSSVVCGERERGVGEGEREQEKEKALLRGIP